MRVIYKYVLLLIFLSILPLTLATTYDASNTTIYECGIITEAGTYTLNQSFSADDSCILIPANEVTLNLNGYTITGNGNPIYGVYTGGDYTLIKNGFVTGFNTGVTSDSNYFSTITNMTTFSNVNGITLSGAYNQTLSENNMSSNTNNFILMWAAMYETAPLVGHNIDTSNILDGSYILYYNSSISDYEFNPTTAPNAGAVICAGCENVEMNNMILNHNSPGLQLMDSVDCIANNITSSSRNGVEIDYGDSNTISNSNLNSSSAGIKLFGTQSNNFENITVNRSANPVYAYSSYYNNFTNLITKNLTGPIYLSGSSSNRFTNLNVWNCSSSTEPCIKIESSLNNVFNSGIINKSAGTLIFSNISSSNNKFSSMTLLGSTNYDLLASGDSSINFVNMTYNSSRLSIEESSEFFKKWYLIMNIIDELSNPISGATITITQNNGTEYDSLTTDSSGNALAELTEYARIMGESNYTDYSNYTINATKGSRQNSTIINATTNLLKSLSLVKVANTFDSLSPTIYSCGNITEAGTYTLNQSIGSKLFSTNGCLDIQAQDVIIDCAGFNITNVTSDMVGGIYSASANTTIENCIINLNQTSALSVAGVYFYNADNSEIYNTTFIGSYYGIYLNQTDDSVVDLVNITSGVVNPIRLYQNSTSSQILNSTIVGASGTGIIIGEYCVGTDIINNTINGTATAVWVMSSNGNVMIGNYFNNNRDHALQIWDSVNNYIYNISIFNSTGRGILFSDVNSSMVSGGTINTTTLDILYVQNSNQNIFMNLELYNAGEGYNDTHLYGSSVNYFLNSTYSLSKEFVEEDAQLATLKFISVNVTDTSNSPIALATVADEFNEDIEELPSSTTDTDGIAELIAVEYLNDGSRTYFNNHTITASKTGYNSNTGSINITLDDSLHIQLTATATPVVRSSGAGGGSGGAGGGSASSYFVNSSQLTEGYTKSLMANQMFNFTLGNQPMHLTINVVKATGVDVTFSSPDQVKTLSPGEEWKIQLADGEFLSVKLNKVINSFASITIQKVKQDSPEITTGENLKEKSTTSTPESSPILNDNYWIWSLGGVIVLILIITLFGIFYKKKPTVKINKARR